MSHADSRGSVVMRKKRFRQGILGAIFGRSRDMSQFRCLYGPPPIKTSDVSNEISSEASKIKEKFDSSSNIPQDIYGPPGIEESEKPTEEFEPS